MSTPHETSRHVCPSVCLSLLFLVSKGSDAKTARIRPKLQSLDRSGDTQAKRAWDLKRQEGRKTSLITSKQRDAMVAIRGTQASEQHTK